MFVTTQNLRLVAVLCFALSFVCNATPSSACSVPVFRYALEHWSPDPFRAVVLHRGPLTREQQVVLESAKASWNESESPVNLTLEAIDLDAAQNNEVLAFESLTREHGLPRVLLLPPKTRKVSKPIGSAPFSREALIKMGDSPARQKIAGDLADGASAVWVLLASGDDSKDSEAASLLEERLSILKQALRLPALDPADIVNGLISVGQEGLRLDFQTIRVLRNDPAEHWLVQCLLASEADLHERTEPMVFPIFGRGRVLHALIGAGINAQTIEEAATFLIGKCSCQVKELNPGTDLVFKADWRKMMKDGQVALPDLPSLEQLRQEQPETVTIRGTTQAAPQALQDSKPLVMFRLPLGVTGWASACGCVVAIAAFVGFSRRR